MKWWASTDWHRDHANIVLPTFEGRPENHSELLLERHNELMSDEDGLLCLGDVIFGMQKNNLHEYLNQFRCRLKVLVRGNHDKKPTKWYLDQGFDMVCDQIVLKGILFSHHPAMLGSDHVLNVHGHEHRGLHRDDEKFWFPRTERHILLSAEYADYYPVSIGDLKNGRYTVGGKVYFKKGCSNGYEARDRHLAEESSTNGNGGQS
jgi:calcineurin-like phosphoesterase family protein